MLDFVLRLGILWLSGVLAVTAIAAARTPGRLTRVLAADTLALVLVALLVLVGYARDSARYLDGALALALLAFAGTLAAARYCRHRRIL